MITLQIEHERFSDEPILTSMYGEKFHIGSSSHCDVKIITYQNDTHIEVLQNEQGVFFKSIGDYSFLHNGKKYQGQRKCQIGDTFQVDRSTIKVVHIDLEDINTPLELQENNCKPKYESILKAIQKELIYSDKEF